MSNEKKKETIGHVVLEEMSDKLTEMCRNDTDLSCYVLGLKETEKGYHVQHFHTGLKKYRAMIMFMELTSDKFIRDLLLECIEIHNSGKAPQPIRASESTKSRFTTH